MNNHTTFIAVAKNLGTIAFSNGIARNESHMDNTFVSLCESVGENIGEIFVALAEAWQEGWNHAIRTESSDRVLV